MLRHRNRILRRIAGARRAFTLIEILLVVVIILTLAAVVGPRLIGHGVSSRIGATKMGISNLRNALGQFEMHAGRLPTGEEGLAALVDKPATLTDTQWVGPYLEEHPLDGFDREFTYKTPPQHGRDYDLISAGPDGEFNTADDITNFKQRRP